MDINPYKFSAPWTAYEFATRMLTSHTKLVLLSMAWLTRLLPQDLELDPESPDMETVAYWLERFHPLVEHAPEEEVVVVFANRCGVEGRAVGSVQVEGGEVVEEGDRVCYAGSSCVMRFQGGTVRMYEKRAGGVAVLGKGEEGVLVVDTGEVSCSSRLVCGFSGWVLTSVWCSKRGFCCSIKPALRSYSAALTSTNARPVGRAVCEKVRRLKFQTRRSVG